MSNIIKVNIDNQLLIELTRQDGTKSIVLNVNEGYQPIDVYSEILKNEFNFNIVSSYGAIDITLIYSYNNNNYTLMYDNDGDSIRFDFKAKDESELEFCRKIAARLKSENLKENGTINVKK